MICNTHLDFKNEKRTFKKHINYTIYDHVTKELETLYLIKEISLIN